MNVEHENRQIMVFFFKCIGISTIIVALRMDMKGLSIKEIALNLLLALQYNIINAIQIGAFNILSLPVFLFFKKKIEKQ